MNFKSFAGLGLSAAMAFSLPTQSLAGSDGIVGGVIGGIIGGAIVKESQKKRTRTVYTQPRVSSATRAENREIQTSLNYFGFPAGTPDGVMGRRSRAAVSQYQAHMGYAPTGQMSIYEKDYLITSYHRALSGGPTTMQLVSTMPLGSRGLLHYYRDQANGTLALQQVQPQPVAPTTQVAVAPAAPVATPEVVESAPSLPSFLGTGGSVSLASHCNTVSLLTNSNGGFTTLASMGEGSTVLDEQFCLARTYAITEGEDMAAQVQGVSASDIEAQCKSLAPVMKDMISALSLQPQGDVLRQVSGFALNSGMAPPQLANTARICLSIGYRTDDMDVAIGSGLLLAALGEGAYAELLGHHLMKGFGASRRDDLAIQWYDTGLRAMEQGKAVFAPGQPERSVLLRTAIAMETETGNAGTMTAPVVPTSALPTFDLGKN